ncbi:MAG TPA: Hsp20/alpha crystallin family protein [Candidatus Polarisedimenticolaceae bacterium]|nr:Hsp20/alpha crystallin family protein [Candidatus Polarisedimenticolaceae bacterium]
MDELFDALGEITRYRSAGVFPAINVSEDPESIYVRAELPGCTPGNLNVTVENDTLTISGERHRSQEEQETSFHRREREWGRFRRSFSLNTRVDSAKVDARYTDGILTVVLPKAVEARPKQIPITTGA